eukprot:SAG31_NODE_2274_length_6037_cov_18.022061_3_plen_93_part_00
MLGFTEATMRAVTEKTVTAILQKEQEHRRAEVAKQLNAKVNQEFAAAVDRAVAEEVCSQSCAGHACIALTSCLAEVSSRALSRTAGRAESDS